MSLAMATAAKLVYAHIVKEPGYCGGKAAIDHTRVRVMNVVFLWKAGKTVEEIRTCYPDLSSAQVHAALSYYYDQVDEIDAELEHDEQGFQQAERDWKDMLARSGGRAPDNPTPEERQIPRPFTPSTE